MGRPPCPESAEFRDVPGPETDKHKLSVCRHCERAHLDDPEATAAPTLIVRRRENFQRHISKCPHMTDDVRFQYVVPSASRSGLAPLSGMSMKAHGPSGVEFVSSTNAPLLEWDQAKINEFYRLLVNFQRENELPDHFVARSSTIRLFEFLAPGISRYIPTPEEMSRMRQAAIAADAAIANVTTNKRRRNV
ncbi:hypothetical protein P43SY_005948 [Pythium insidiosum]|uniref:Uncharacterized protein n=1 Tax=Pythium insidiosum TaxID=114742 RepID=A0AAD5LLF0_PYTIN|nr:hypothetical protein P43SY_005948 [Pythium insidiosum]